MKTWLRFENCSPNISNASAKRWTSRSLFLLAICASAAFLSSCEERVGSGDGGGSGGEAQFGDLCSSHADCLPDLQCGEGRGYCTLGCSSDEFCIERFGPLAYCVQASYPYGCFLRCDTDSDCSGDLRCSGGGCRL